MLAFVVTLVVGPTLISADLRNNGLPLYLARPFTRTEYLLGKSAVLILLLALQTWVPGLLLFGFQAYLGGPAWLAEHWRIGVAIPLAAWIWTAVLCLISLALSAYLRWRTLAQAGLFGVFFVAAVLSGLVNLVLDTTWGGLLNISDMISVVWAQLFGVTVQNTLPPWAAWTALLALCAGCVGLLARKVRAYEVVRS
jgi:ABC-2 type transport system permease protein